MENREYYEEIKVYESEVGIYLDLLDKMEIDLEKHGIPQDETLFEITKEFQNGMAGRLKICSGTDNLFVDAILEDQECNEVCLLDPEDDILGEFWFEDDKNHEYILNVLLIAD